MSNSIIWGNIKIINSGSQEKRDNFKGRVGQRLVKCYLKQCHIFPISAVQVIPSFSQANLSSPQRSTVSQQVNKFNFNAMFNA